MIKEWLHKTISDEGWVHVKYRRPPSRDLSIPKQRYKNEQTQMRLKEYIELRTLEMLNSKFKE